MAENSGINPKSLNETGNLDSFKEFYEQHKDLVYNVCCRFLNDQDDAKDASQDIFLKILHSLDSFRSESKISTWIYRICVNHCLNQIRKKKTLQIFSLDFFFERTNSKDIIDTSIDIHDSIEKREAEVILKNAIDSLPANQKTAIILSKFEELSYEEIAKIMNCSISSVESLLFRAKQNLSKKLGKTLKKSASFKK